MLVYAVCCVPCGLAEKVPAANGGGTAKVTKKAQTSVSRDSDVVPAGRQERSLFTNLYTEDI